MSQMILRANKGSCWLVGTHLQWSHDCGRESNSCHVSSWKPSQEHPCTQISPCLSNKLAIRNTCPPKYPTELQWYPTRFTALHRTRIFQNSTSLAFQREHRAVSKCNPHRVCVASSMADPSAEPSTSCDSNMGATHWCPWYVTPF